MPPVPPHIVVIRPEIWFFESPLRLRLEQALELSQTVVREQESALSSEAAAERFIT